MFINDKRNQPVQVKKKTHRPGYILPVFSASTLLVSPRHETFLYQLRKLIDIPDELYAQLYQATINAFAEYVQVLPTVVNGSLSGLLNDGLVRAYLMVKTLLDETKLQDPLMVYAAFTAGLFIDVSRIITNYKVVITTEKGDYLDDWQPFRASLFERGTHYKLYELAPVYQNLEKNLTPMLAQHIMPEDAYLWVAHDLKVFADWLDILCGDKLRGGKLVHILSLIKPEDMLALLEKLQHVPIEIELAEVDPYGEQFLEWLKEGIEKGDIPLNSNDSGVHVVEDGLFLERAKVFQQFVEMTRAPVNSNVVFAQFGNLLGIPSKGGNDYMHAQFFSEGSAYHTVSFSSGFGNQSGAMRDGMLLSDASVVLTGSKSASVSSQLKTSAKVADSHKPPVGSPANLQNNPNQQK